MPEPKITDRPRDALKPGEADSRYFSAGQAAKILGVSTRTLERHRKSGKLVPDSRTPGGHARYSAAQLSKAKEPEPAAPVEEPESAYAFIQRVITMREIRALKREGSED